MENKELLEILYRIQACLIHNDWDSAKEYVQLELSKLKENIVEKN